MKYISVKEAAEKWGLTPRRVGVLCNEGCIEGAYKAGASMFSLIKVGERSGMGLYDLYTNWRNRGYENPMIEETIFPPP